ncbi:hypothetical protein C8J57DRAFT_1515127 [Mycena rebaudengoi]|nr:hypothetical protein C8J57DRAFT_1515127 [Mycena rebaudengoi]
MPLSRRHGCGRPGPERAAPLLPTDPQPPYRLASTHMGTHSIPLRPPQLPLSVPARLDRARPLTSRRSPAHQSPLHGATSLHRCVLSFFHLLRLRFASNRLSTPTIGPVLSLSAARKPSPCGHAAPRLLSPLPPYAPNATHNPAYQAAHAPQSRFRALLCVCGGLMQSVASFPASKTRQSPPRRQTYSEKIRIYDRVLRQSILPAGANPSMPDN